MTNNSIVKPWDKVPSFSERMDQEVLEIASDEAPNRLPVIEASVVDFMHNNGTLSESQQKLSSIESSFRSKRSVIVRKAFVLEYIKDFNARAAVKRMYPKKTRRYCDETGNRLMQCGYVLTLIDIYLKEVEASSLIKRAEIVRMFIEQAHYYGEGSSHGARVAALKELAKIQGMYINRSVSVNLDQAPPVELEEKTQKQFIDKLKLVLDGGG